MNQASSQYKKDKERIRQKMGRDLDKLLTQKDDPTTETQTRKKIQNRIHTRANAFVYDDLKKRTKEKEREMEKLGKAGEKRGQNRQRAPLPIHS